MQAPQPMRVPVSHKLYAQHALRSSLLLMIPYNYMNPLSMNPLNYINPLSDEFLFFKEKAIADGMETHMDDT